MWTVRDKRINAAEHAVFELYRDRFHVATIEVRGDWPGGIKVLLGGLQPVGKERAWEAIRRYEADATVEPRYAPKLRMWG